jgi:(2Fe-2S) ferredoxin
MVCVNQRFGADTPSCGAGGGERFAARLGELLAARGVTLEVERIRCFGRCAEGPNLRLAPGGPFWRGVTDAELPAIADAIAATLAECPGRRQP